MELIGIFTCVYLAIGAITVTSLADADFNRDDNVFECARDFAKSAAACLLCFILACVAWPLIVLDAIDGEV